MTGSMKPATRNCCSRVIQAWRIAAPRYYWICKLQARFLAADYRLSAIEAAAKVERLLWTTPAHIEVPEYHYYGALARAADCTAAPVRGNHLSVGPH